MDDTKLWELSQRWYQDYLSPHITAGRWRGSGDFQSCGVDLEFLAYLTLEKERG